MVELNKSPPRFAPSYPLGIVCSWWYSFRSLRHFAILASIRPAEWATIEFYMLCSPVNSIRLISVALFWNWKTLNLFESIGAFDSEFHYLPIAKFIRMQNILDLSKLFGQRFCIDVESFVDAQQLEIVLKIERKSSSVQNMCIVLFIHTTSSGSSSRLWHFVHLNWMPAEEFSLPHCQQRINPVAYRAIARKHTRSINLCVHWTDIAPIACVVRPVVTFCRLCNMFVDAELQNKSSEFSLCFISGYDFQITEIPIYTSTNRKCCALKIENAGTEFLSISPCEKCELLSVCCYFSLCYNWCGWWISQTIKMSTSSSSDLSYGGGFFLLDNFKI